MRSSDALTDPRERFSTLANEHMTTSPLPLSPILSVYMCQCVVTVFECFAIISISSYFTQAPSRACNISTAAGEGAAKGERGGWEGGAAMATPTAFQLSVRAYPADNKQSAQQAKQPDVPMHHAPCPMPHASPLPSAVLPPLSNASRIASCPVDDGVLMT